MWEREIGNCWQRNLSARAYIACHSSFHPPLLNSHEFVAINYPMPEERL